MITTVWVPVFGSFGFGLFRMTGSNYNIGFGVGGASFFNVTFFFVLSLILFCQIINNNLPYKLGQIRFLNY